jgi:hypothetical protein
MPRFDADYEAEERGSDAVFYNATPASSTYTQDFPTLPPTMMTTPLQTFAEVLANIATGVTTAPPYRYDALALQRARDELDESVVEGAFLISNATTDANMTASLDVESTVAAVRRVLPPRVVHQEMAALLNSSVEGAKETLDRLLRDGLASLQADYMGPAQNNTEVRSRAFEEGTSAPGWMPSPDLPWAMAITAVTAAGLLALVASRWICARRTAASACLAVSRPNHIANIVARILVDDLSSGQPEQIEIEMPQVEPQDLARQPVPTPSTSQGYDRHQPPPPPPSAASSWASGSGARN